MHTDRGHIRSCIHGINRKAFSEIKMCAVGLVYQNLHIPVMGKLYDLPEIGTDSIISRIVYKHSHCIRIFLNGFLYLFQLHSQRNTKPVVHIRIYIDRCGSAQYKSVDHASVYVSGQNNLVALLTAGKNHGLNRGCCSPNHKKCACRAKCFCCKLFCLLDHRNRMAEIIKGFHRVYVYTDALTSK